jgi:hypothetical protein
MSKYFVKLDGNNIVTQGTVLEDSVAATEAKGEAYLNKIYKTSDTWKETLKGVTKDHTYDPDTGVFIPPKPSPTWVLDENNTWHPPVPYPDDGGNYYWDDPSQTWISR